MAAGEKIETQAWKGAKSGVQGHPVAKDKAVRGPAASSPLWLHHDSLDQVGCWEVSALQVSFPSAGSQVTMPPSPLPWEKAGEQSKQTRVAMGSFHPSLRSELGVRGRRIGAETLECTDWALP